MVAPRRFALLGHTHNLDDLVGDTDDLTEGSTNLFFTDERAQDAVGTILADSASINFTYTDGTPEITAAVIAGGVDHGGLAGLSDDDHPQYPLAAGTETISGAWSITTNPLITNTVPALKFYDTNDSANTGKWWIQPASQLFRIFAVDDAETGTTAALSISRTNATPTAFMLPLDNYALQIGASQDLQLYHDGTDSFISNATGKLRMPQDLWITGAAQRSLYLEDTSATSGERVWRWIASGGDFFLQARTDADAGACTPLEFVRNGSALTKILITANAGVLRLGDLGNSSTREFQIVGSADQCYFMYGSNEDIYLRGGQADSNIWIGDGSSGTVTIGGTGAQPLVMNSSHASGPYMTLARSGAAFGYFGNGSQMGGSFTADALAFDSAGNPFQIGTNGTKRLDISTAGVFTFSTTRLTQTASNPGFLQQDTSAPTDEKNWIYEGSGGNLYLQAYSDSFGTAGTALFISRTGITIDQIQLGGAAVYINPTVSTNTLEIVGGGLKTANPNTSAVPWRLGSASVVSPTSPNRTLEVSVNGTLYYIAAKTTND